MLDIIYNMTSVCPHDCAGCCVDATHVIRRGNDVILRTKGLTAEQRIPRGDRSIGIYDLAARHLQQRAGELTLEQKLAVVANLDVENVRLDVSGGDPLVVTENISVLHAASAKLGASNVTLTATGAGMAKVDLDSLVKIVGEFNFTFDSASPDDVADRPPTYASRNLVLGRELAARGAKTRAEFPITRPTSSPDHVERLYRQLHEAKIGKLLLMRLFAVGRGPQLEGNTLTPDEYRIVIRQLRDLEAKFGNPVVSLQCALRHLEGRLIGPAQVRQNPCDMVRESFGLTPKGVLLASPWAVNGHGEPMDEVFILGNLATTPLSVILESPKVREMRARADENFGICKIFAFQHSLRVSAMDRLFDNADPLYTGEVIAQAAAE